MLAKSKLDGVRHIVVEIHPHITGTEAVALMSSAVVAQGFEIKKQAHKTILFSR